MPWQRACNHFTCLSVTSPHAHEQMHHAVIGEITRVISGQQWPLVLDSQAGSSDGVDGDTRTAWKRVWFSSSPPSGS